MNRPFIYALFIASLLGTGAFGYWLGQRPPAKAPETAAIGEPLSFVRYEAQRAQPRRDDPDSWIPDDDDRVRDRRPVERVCLEFSKPLAPLPVERYRDFIKVAGTDAPTIALAPGGLCFSGWPKDAAKLDVTIVAALAATDGTRMSEDTKLAIDLNLPSKEKFVAFAGSGFILPTVGANGIAVETRNVDRVRVRVLRVTDTKIIRDWPKRRPRNGDDESDYYDDAARRLLGGGGFVVWDGTMAVENRGNDRSVTSFPLTRVLPERRPGAYLMIVDEDERADKRGAWYSGSSATRWLIETDIGLTVFQGEDGLNVLARSYDTAQPLASIDVVLVAENGRDLARIATDASGRAQFARGQLQGQNDNRPYAVYAYGADGSFALLDLNRPAFDLSDRGVSGLPAPRPISAFLYADRGIYRPGEVVNLSGLMRRDNADALDTPLTLVVQRPNGAEFRRRTLRPDAGGGVHLGLELPPSAVRGKWTALAYADPTDQPVGRLAFEVQDFVPQRLSVHGTTSSDVYDPKSPPAIDIVGEWLYGAPAAGLQGFGDLRIVRDPNPFPQLRGWRFGRHDDQFEDVLVKLEVGSTNDEGKLTVKLATADLRATMPLKAMIGFGIYEPGGRPTEERLGLAVRHRPLFLGIKPEFEDNRVANNMEAVLKVAAFDAEGRPAAKSSISWRFDRENWNYIWYRDERQGRWTYRTSVTLETLQSGEWSLAADGTQELRYVTDRWQRYRLTVEDAETGAATSYRFTSGYGSASPDDDIPDKIAVIAEKPVYAVGATAHIAIRPPFAGEAMVAVATNRILWSRQITVPADGTAIDVPVTTEWGAGAYVLVDAVRPLQGGSARDPARAIGLAWVAVDNAARQVTVALAAPDLALPQRGLTIPVSVAGLTPGLKTYLTVAAVDEGILALTRFASPSPGDFYFGKRRLGLDIRDDYGRLLDGQAGPAGRTRHGGDEVGGAGLQSVPTRTVSLFSGPIEVGADGKAQVSFELPDFVGQLRLMAVAYNGSQVGQGEAKVLVRHPLVADAYFPRFLAPGDRARMTLFVQNVDAPAGDYSFAVTADGPTSVTGDGRLALSLAPRESRNAAFELTAGALGISTIRLAVRGPNGLAFDREWQIETRSPHYPLTVEHRRTLAAGEDFALPPLLLAPFLPGSAKITVNVSAIRGIDVPGLLQSLYRYPYGCTEQTTSVAFPLLSFDDFRLLGLTSATEAEQIRRRVQRAVDALLDRQDESGAIGLWRAGDRGSDSWLIVFATDFLLQARERGYVLPDDALARSQRYLHAVVNGRHDDDSYGYVAASGSAELSRAYAHYLLARLGRGELAMLQRQLPEFAKTRLHVVDAFAGAALAFMGERERGAEILRRAGGPVDNRFLVYYSSRLRDRALGAALATEALGAAAAQPFLDEIERANRSADQLSTQEKAWLLRAAAALKRSVDIHIAENGVERVGNGVAAMTLAPSNDVIAAGYTLTNRSSGPVAATLSVHGAPSSPPPPLENGFRLTKKVFAPDGTAIDVTQPDSVRRHDRLIVVLEGEARDRSYHQAILVDPLPAGWEIEGLIAPPRGKDEPPPYPWLKPLSIAQMMERRDDRFVAAFELNGDPDRPRFYVEPDEERLSRTLPPGRDYRFAYIVRAVTPGVFTLPEAAVEDMYRSERMARTAPGFTTVRAE
ncbi:MAG: alpha-2-macroglobulin family protein [Proteobacteria bacterium]|nr:alpha-2-macroglobulin family protein [Pseudomonadota bacterium]